MSKIMSTAAVVVDEASINVAVAKRALECVDRQQDFASGQVASMANWLMASLLAINGGGALATISAAKEAHSVWIAGVLFALGVGLALMSAVRMQDTYNAAVVSLAEQGQYWAGVSITGQRDECQEQSNAVKAARVQRWAFLPPTFGWISGVSFIAGAIILVVTLQRGHQANDQRCTAIEHEMLTNLLKRPGDINLFAALGCTPSGQ